VGQQDSRAGSVNGVVPVARILSPKSIVIVGASSDPRSFGGFVLGNLERFGFSGDIHLISRSSAEINGRPCLKDIAELPPGVDLAVLAIPENGILEAVLALGTRGVGAAVIFASGYGEAGEEGQTKQRALAEAAQRANILLIGPNCMGFTNVAGQVPVTFEPIQAIVSGELPGVSILAQSGFMAANLRDGMLGRGLPLSLIFSTGNEVSICIEDVLAHVIGDANTRVIAMYVEQVRRPQVFLRLAAEARAKGKPIVMLMPGRSERARAAAQSHTGALAGDHAIACAWLKREGVVLVNTLDELFDVTAILQCHPKPCTGGTAFVTGSGAMKNIAIDFADSIALALPQLTEPTRLRLKEMLPSFAVAENPLDYTTIGVRQPGLIGEILQVMSADPLMGSLLLCIPAGPSMAQRDKADHILPAIAKIEKPVVLVITGDSGPMETFFIDAIRKCGVPFFRSADRALRALQCLNQFGEAVARAGRIEAARKSTLRPAVPPWLTDDRYTLSAETPQASPKQRGDQQGEKNREQKSEQKTSPLPITLPEYAGKAWLAKLGIAIPEGALANSQDQALELVRRMGYPVVLKAQSAALPHKSEVGGVLLGIADDAALVTAWGKLHANIQHHRPGLSLDGVLIEAMGAKGLELVIGTNRDADWGPVILVGLGGIWIEVLKDVRIMAADLTQEDIADELRKLKAAAILEGVRGAQGVDIDAIARLASELGAQMLLQPEILEIDINPLLAYPRGSQNSVMALDALVVIDQAAIARHSNSPA
jgi:acetate---CoA ligase (ADP-forming)